MNKYKVFFDIYGQMNSTEVKASDYIVKDGFLVFTKKVKLEPEFDEYSKVYYTPTVTKTVATFRDWSRVELLDD